MLGAGVYRTVLLAHTWYRSIGWIATDRPRSTHRSGGIVTVRI